MEQNRMEEEFRKKLGEREIAPTPAAWDRLDAMLAVAEGKPAKCRFNWLYIAAAFLGFILIGTVFFNQTQISEGVKGNEVVIENNETKSPEQNANEAVSIPEVKPESQQVVAQSETNVEKTSAGKTVIKRNTEPEIVREEKNQAIADKQPVSPKEQNIENPKANTIKSSVAVNVDELLAGVEKSSPKESKKSTVKVDPNSLLSQVDGELELSFRERTIYSISKKYQSVKVALANRNNKE